MKKILSVMLMLTLVLFIFTGCGGGPDLTGVNEKFNEVSALFNETAALLDSNGWSNDPEMLATHNSMADDLNEIKAIIEDPEQTKNMDVDEMIANLDAMIPALNDYKAAISVPAVPVVDLTGVKDKYNEVSAVFNEAATLANTNGWGNDAEMVSTHNSIAEDINRIGALIEDPEQSPFIDVEQLTADLDEMILMLNDYRDAVSVPYGTSLDLTALSVAYNETADLYTKVTEQAVTNGWQDNETLTATLNDISATLDDCYKILEDPSVLEGSDMTQADIDDYEGLIKELHSILTDTLPAVSVPQ